MEPFLGWHAVEGVHKSTGEFQGQLLSWIVKVAVVKIDKKLPFKNTTCTNNLNPSISGAPDVCDWRVLLHRIRRSAIRPCSIAGNAESRMKSSYVIRTYILRTCSYIQRKLDFFVMIVNYHHVSQKGGH